MSAQKGCSGGVRHWFTIRGQVRLRSPVCVRCGAPSPRPLSAEEWAILAQVREAGIPLGMHATGALREHQREQQPAAPRGGRQHQGGFL